jgi:hypothetical protein
MTCCIHMSWYILFIHVFIYILHIHILHIHITEYIYIFHIHTTFTYYMYILHITYTSGSIASTLPAPVADLFYGKLTYAISNMYVHTICNMYIHLAASLARYLHLWQEIARAPLAADVAPIYHAILEQVCLCLCLYLCLSVGLSVCVCVCVCVGR